MNKRGMWIIVITSTHLHQSLQFLEWEQVTSWPIHQQSIFDIGMFKLKLSGNFAVFKFHLFCLLSKYFSPESRKTWFWRNQTNFQKGSCQCSITAKEKLALNKKFCFDGRKKMKNVFGAIWIEEICMKLNYGFSCNVVKMCSHTFLVMCYCQCNLGKSIRTQKFSRLRKGLALFNLPRNIFSGAKWI